MTTNPHALTYPARLVREQDLHLSSLVLSSVNIDHTVQRSEDDTFMILVREGDLHRAQYELDTFEQENRNWPPSTASTDDYSPLFRAYAFLITGLLVLFFSATGPWSDYSVWFTEGSARSADILQGEYYRLVTALTLHADIVHLLGNCFLGAILLHFFFHITGNGIGGASLVFASAAANYANAALHGPGHNSVGFSTSVFAVIGMLSILNYSQYRLSRPMQILMPLMSGTALLAMLGSSGERTDLGAHFFGLIAGFFTGFILVAIHYRQYRKNLLLQILLATAALAVPFWCWQLALP